MENRVHTFKIDLSWELINLISQIDRFDASWVAVERREGQTLKQLKAIATVRSVGASTRIEGSTMSDEEVERLLSNIDITKLEDRDAQEVVGYFETLDIISEAYEDIGITENSLKNLHNILMKHSQKDQWHRGDYKQHNNAVEANYPDGSKQLIFRTTEAGVPTQDAMRGLMNWYREDTETHPLVKCALFQLRICQHSPLSGWEWTTKSTASLATFAQTRLSLDSVRESGTRDRESENGILSGFAKLSGSAAE